MPLVIMIAATAARGSPWHADLHHDLCCQLLSCAAGRAGDEGDRVRRRPGRGI